MYHLWFICFYMIRLGSTKKGRLRPSSILQQKGNHLGKKNIPFLHRQSWCRYQINPIFELPATKGSGKSTGLEGSSVRSSFWLGTLTTLKIYSSQTDKLSALVFWWPPDNSAGHRKSWSCFMEKNTQIVNDMVSPWLIWPPWTSVGHEVPYLGEIAEAPQETGMQICGLIGCDQWPARWKMKDEAHKYQVPVWCQTNYTFVWDVHGQTASYQDENLRTSQN